MDSGQLIKILDSPEGATLEFKKSFQFEDAVAKTICAFANTFGGLIVFGVEKRGNSPIICNISDPDAEFQKLARIVSRLNPKPYYNAEAYRHEDKQLIIVNVNPMPVSEMAFIDKIAYRRVGSVNEPLSGLTLVRFLQQRGTICFEENASNAAMEDLSEEKIRGLLAQMNGKINDHEPLDIVSILGSLGVANVLGQFFLKNAAVLFFAKDIRRFFMNPEIRVVKFRGKQKGLEALESDSRFANTLPELLGEVLLAVKEKAGVFSRIEGAKRIEAPMIPDEVLREALTNAVGHRDYFDPNGILAEIYDDRIEITNPGSLLPGLTLDNFREVRKARNPIVYRLLNESQWGEGLNLGIKAMYRIMRQNKLPDPEFEDLGSMFKVTLFGQLSERKVRPYGIINERQIKAIEYFKKNQSLSAPEYAKICGISHPTAIRDLNELVAQGILIRMGKQRSSKYVLDKNIKT